MSPTDYDTVVNVKAYSLVKNTSDVTLTRELDGIFFVVFFCSSGEVPSTEFRYIRDERSNSENDSPRLLKAFFSRR